MNLTPRQSQIVRLLAQGHTADQCARAQAAAERKEAILAANSRGLMRPLNHIAEVSKMVGGNRHV